MVAPLAGALGFRANPVRDMYIGVLRAYDLHLTTMSYRQFGMVRFRTTTTVHWRPAPTTVPIWAHPSS